MKKGKDLDFKKQFREAEAYLKESQYYIYFAFLVFAAATLVGFVWAEQFAFLGVLLSDLVGQTIGMNGTELIFFILQNNLQSAFFGFLGGIFLGVFPLFNAIINGIVLGYVAELVVSEVGAGQLIGLLPHGIFELPAIFISLGMGVKLGLAIFAKDKAGEFRRRFFEGANVFLFVVVPLLVIAAIIEGVLIALL